MVQRSDGCAGRGPGGAEPPSRPEGIPASDKVGIDATAKPSLAKFAAKPRVPDEVMDRIKLDDFVPNLPKRQKDRAPAASSVE